MSRFPIDRKRPPSRIVVRDAAHALEIRPWALADVDALIAAVTTSAPELRPFMPWAHVLPTREDEYALVAKFQADYWAGREYVMGVFGAGGEVLGGVGLHPRVPLNPSGLEVGYWCNTPYAGRGITTLVVKVLAALAFDRFGCERFQVMHDEANVASRRVVEKCGFTYEGTLRNVVAAPTPALVEGGYRGTPGHRMYAILPDALPRLAWLPAVRAATTLYDALGGEQRL